MVNSDSAKPNQSTTQNYPSMEQAQVQNVKSPISPVPINILLSPVSDSQSCIAYFYRASLYSEHLNYLERTAKFVLVKMNDDRIVRFSSLTF